MQNHTATLSADFPLSVLRLSWCSDCQADALFEAPPTHDVDSATDMACTACGAAYFDALDTILDVTIARSRTVA